MFIGGLGGGMFIRRFGRRYVYKEGWEEVCL